MNPTFVGIAVFGCVSGAALLAIRLRAALPHHHLSADTKDTVKLAMGLVATMTALVLGLLVSSAKGSFDTQRNAVLQMAGKAVFLDRVLAHYGPEAAEARAALRQALQGALAQTWPENSSQQVTLAPNITRSEALYDAVQKLAPQTDTQRSIKAQAMAMTSDLGQMRWLLFEQSNSSISSPLVVIVVVWLAILFSSFGLFGPSNSTAIASLMVGAASVSGAVFLILELDRPFGGLIRISSQPVINAISQLGQ
jgi:hypothetical protein